MLNDREVQEASRIRAALSRRLAEIAEDRGITKREADRQRARAVLGARNDMSSLREKSAERSAAESAKAYKAAFGIRPDRSAEDRQYRDSLAARNLTPGEAQALMAQAIARGDDVAMTALAELAWTHRGDELDGGRHWEPILQSYGEFQPSAGAAMADLADLTPGKIERFTEKLATEIATPSGLSGNLEYLARDDEDNESRSSGSHSSSSGIPWGA